MTVIIIISPPPHTHTVEETNTLVIASTAHLMFPTIQEAITYLQSLENANAGIKGSQ